MFFRCKTLFALSAIVATAATCVRPAPTTSTPASPRFSLPHEIIIGPDSGIEVVADRIGRKPSPAYPDDARRNGIEAFPIIAFVVDTAGRIELPTVSFLDVPPPLEFQRSLCQWATMVRLTPYLLDGRAQRMLLVQPFSFEINRGPGSSRGPAMGAAATYRQRMRSTPLVDVIQALNTLPHC